MKNWLSPLSKILRKWFLIFTISLMIVVNLPSRIIAQNFEQIYVFGDSLSDVGNVFNATDGQSPPSPPYFQGRYSNGPVWVEYLAPKLGAIANPNNNFAYGGATAVIYQGIPALPTQIERFQATHSSINPNALYVIWIGSNDYLRGVTSPTVPVNNIINAVQSLATMGAQNIAVFNLPSLGKIPGTRNTDRSEQLNALTNQHNTELATALNQLTQPINPIYFDINTRFNQVLENPERFGFRNVTQACINQGQICNNPNEYLFLDDIHPTTLAHQLIAEWFFSGLQSSPENSTVSAPELGIFLVLFIVGALGVVFLFQYKRVARSR